MADTRDQAVWTGHAAQQLEIAAYRPQEGGLPDRLTAALNAEEWMSVLDFGCGTGLWRAMFPPTFNFLKRYIGLDQNEAMIAGAKQRWPDEIDSFILCPGVVDGATMPFEDGRFDVVFTSAVLQHCTDGDKVPVLREIRRVLRRGGRLIMFENTFGWFNPGEEDGRSHSQDAWRGLIEPFGFARTSVDRDLHVFRAM